jgi:methionine biosynthesis protein MetW
MSQAIEHLQGMEQDELRADLGIIAEWIKADAKVLDLGCGDGTLLAYLRDQRDVLGYGLEIDLFNIEACVEKNLNVIQANLNDGLKAYFADNSTIFRSCSAQLLITAIGRAIG